MTAMSEKPELDSSKVAYQLPQPTGMMPDVFFGGALDLDGDERDWVPQSTDVSFKPLVLSVSQGYYVNILRVRAAGSSPAIVIAGPCTPSRCAASGAIWSMTGSPRPAITPSSRRARLTPSLCPRTCERWPRCSMSRAATPTSIPTARRSATRTCSPSSRTCAAITSTSASARITRTASCVKGGRDERGEDRPSHRGQTVHGHGGGPGDRRGYRRSLRAARPGGRRRDERG